MTKTKEELRQLVKQAIPNPDAGIVNFRALRDVLAATIDHPSTNGIISSSTDAPEDDCGDTNDSNDKKSGKTTARSSVVGNRNIKNVTEKLDAIVCRFDAFSEDLAARIEKLNNRVSKLECTAEK